MISLESIIFVIVSLISASLVYFGVPKSTLFVVLSILIAALLVFFSKFQLGFLQKKEHKPHLRIALFLTSLFIQILLIATGGFFSAFIIIMYLFTLGMSLILNVKSSILFLLLSVGVLSSMILFDPQTIILFKQDPWSFLLHGVSFLVIIPLANMMVSSYHLKDAVTKVLSDHLKTKEMQDESIFRGIGEFVLILNSELKTIFANEALKKSLNIDGDISNRNLFDFLPLHSINGGEVNTRTLSIDQAIADRSAHIVRGFYLGSKESSHKMPVSIQVRPIYETNGDLKQIILVLVEDRTGMLTDAVDLKLAKAKRVLLQQELENELKQSTKDTQIHYNLLLEQINDALLFEDLQSHGITPNRMLINMTDFIPQKVSMLNKLFDTTGTIIDIELTQESLVRLATEMSSKEYSLYSFAKKSLLASVDGIWLQELLHCLTKLLLVISLATDKKIIIRSGYNDNGELVMVCATKSPLDIGFSAQELLLQNYGKLQNHQTLKFGSGLEGVLAKKIAETLNYPLMVNFDQKSALLSVVIKLPTDLK